MLEPDDRRRRSRKKNHAKKLLLENDKKYRLLGDRISDIIWALDLKTFKLEYVSPSVEMVTGYTSEEVIGYRLDQVATPAAMEKVKEIFLQEYNREKRKKSSAQTLDIEVYHKENKKIWLEVSANFYRNDHDEAVGIVGVARECSKRKQAEEELRLNKERYRNFLSNSKEAYCEIDLEGSIVFCNDAAGKIAGCPNEELIEAKSRQFVSLTDARKMFDIFHQLVQSGSPVKDIECEIRSVDGKKKSIEFSVSPIKNIEGNVTGFCCTGRKIGNKGQKKTVLKKDYDELKLQLTERTAELKRASKAFENSNTAFQVLLEKKNEISTELGKKIIFSVKELIRPVLEKLAGSGLNTKQKTYVNIIEANLNNIIDPFFHGDQVHYQKLTPNEIQIANFIKNGKTTKEIAELMNIAGTTVNFHRDNLRRKLNLKNRKINLQAYLRSRG